MYNVYKYSVKKNTGTESIMDQFPCSSYALGAHIL